MTAVDLAVARRAHRLGIAGHALGQKLGVSTAQANTIAEVGRALARIEGAALTDAEILVMKTIAAVARARLKEGITRTPESRVVSARLGKAPGWCAATVRRRIFLSRQNRLTGRAEQGLGFVDLAGNGFVWLTPAGWALILALEAGR